MILIQFPDRETEIKGLAVLMSGFSGKVLAAGFISYRNQLSRRFKAQRFPTP